MKKLLQKLTKLPIEQQIFFSSLFAGILLLLLGLCLMLGAGIRRQQLNIDTTISNTATYVASLEGVSRMLDRGYPDPAVRLQLDHIHQHYQDIDTITVYDRSGLRFYHTSRLDTGDTFVAGEELPILEGADPYITTGYGTQGSQRKAFCGVKNEQGEINGFVTVAIFSADIFSQIRSILLIFAGILGISLLVAGVLSWGIVQLLRQTLQGYHPAKLLDLYLRRGEVLDALEDGLIATDRKGKVVFANAFACRLFGQEREAMEGRPLTDIFPETSCLRAAQTGQAIHNRSMVIQQRQVLSSALPIQGEEGLQGVLSIFHDKTELRKLSDELSGARDMLDTMRMFNHEFMNKLHVILGYLQTGQIQEATQFIINSSLVSSHAIRETADCIRVPRLCALVIGKMMHAAELGILLSVSRDSCCREEDLLLPVEDCATILGNLLENAIEELDRGKPEVAEINLSIYCRTDCNIVTCEDTGRGIPPDVLPHIWEKGFSSKGENRGFGLYLLRQLIEKHGGVIQLDTEAGEGTCFTLTFTSEKEA